MHREQAGSSTPNHTPDNLLLLKLEDFLVPGGNLDMTIGLCFNSLAVDNLANLRVGGANSTGLGLRPPEFKSCYYT